METKIPAIGGDVYEVEKILRKKRHPSKGIQYFVKWRHYPSSANTWEPACNFASELIDDFEASQKTKRQKLTHNTNSKSSSSSSATSTSKSSGQPTPSSSSNSSTASSSSSSQNSSRIHHLKHDSDQDQDDDDGDGDGPSSVNTESRISRKFRRDQRRQEQLKLQYHIQQQQQQRLQAPVNRHQLAVFNPNGTHRLPAVEEVVYEPKLTKEPIIVTDVTSKDSTVTISECKTPEGFFSVNMDCWDK